MVQLDKKSPLAPGSRDDEIAAIVPANNCRRFNSRQLFAAASELVIDHEGTRYRLRITRQGKLILTK